MKTLPMEHQKKIMLRLKQEINHALLWDMGTGKTWIGIWKIEQSIKAGNCNHLIIAPNQVKDVWSEQIKEHGSINPRHISIFSGDRSQRLKELSKNNLIYIINYESLRTFSKQLSYIDWDIIIADESQRIKNPKAKQTKGILSLTSNSRLICTGTPIINNYLDIFSQWLFLDEGKTFGTNYYVFRNEHFEDKNAGRYRGNFPDWQLKKGHDKIIQIMMAPLCSRQDAKDCIDLPKKISTKKYVYLTPSQNKHTMNLLKESITQIKEMFVTATMAAIQSIRYSQITSGFMKTEDGKILRFKINPKLDLIKEIIPEILSNPKNKVIIWAHFKADIQILEKTFYEYSPVVLYGGSKLRSGDVEKTFNYNPRCRMFIGNPKSAGLGLNLIAGNYACYYSYSHALEDRWQSLRRNYRKGSEMHERITYIDIIAKGTIDEVILKNLGNKKKMATEILDYIKLKGGLM